MEIEQTKDTIVRKLTVTTGEELEIMANITSRDMVDVRMEALVDELLGDEIGVAEYRALYRTSISKDGRGREDLTTLGKTADRGWKEGEPRR